MRKFLPTSTVVILTDDVLQISCKDSRRSECFAWGCEGVIGVGNTPKGILKLDSFQFFAFDLMSC